MTKTKFVKFAGFVALVVGSFVSTTASAQFYLGGGVGRSKPTGADATVTVLGVPVTATGGNTSKTSWKLYGGYQFTENWGIEGQYVNLGDRTYTVSALGVSGSGKIKANEWGLAGTGKLPLSNDFYLMAKLGASRNHVGGGNFTVAGFAAPIGGTSKTSLLAGAGAGYDFTKNVGVRLEYENFGKFCGSCGPTNNAIKASNWALDLQYKF
jgi:OOP family OmpA-OmpF porin